MTVLSTNCGAKVLSPSEVPPKIKVAGAVVLLTIGPVLVQTSALLFEALLEMVAPVAVPARVNKRFVEAEFDPLAKLLVPSTTLP